MSLHRRVLCVLFFTLAASSLLAQTPTQVSVTTGQGGSVISAPGLSETAPYAPTRVIVRFQPGAPAGFASKSLKSMEAFGGIRSEVAQPGFR